ncbi:MAG: ribonuclease HI family protein [Candidatus Krumholzibacteriia bacterium]
MENAPADKPETLVDLLKTLERSADLRVLARDCGLSVRELRRRLAIWRRALNEEGTPADGPTQGDQSGRTASSGPRERAAERHADAPDLTPAASIPTNPLAGSQAQVMEVFTDGASRGNPGPAAIGAVFRPKGGPAVAGHSEAIGKATNNVAEYRAVVVALEHCVRWGVERVHLYMDSELIVRQLHGVYRVKSPDLRPLYQQVVFLGRQFTEFRVSHVKRGRNAEADALANKALDAGK